MRTAGILQPEALFVLGLGFSLGFNTADTGFCSFARSQLRPLEIGVFSFLFGGVVFPAQFFPAHSDNRNFSAKMAFHISLY